MPKPGLVDIILALALAYIGILVLVGLVSVLHLA